MSKYYVLNDIDFYQFGKDCIIKLKKVYQITLLDIFPQVLESLINEYIHDVIEVKINSSKKRTYPKQLVIVHFDIINQYICYNQVSFSFDIMIRYIEKFIYNIKVNDSLNICQLLNKCETGAQYHEWPVLNVYMKTCYNKNDYFNIKHSKHEIYPKTSLTLSQHSQAYRYNNIIIDMTSDLNRINIYKKEYGNLYEYGYVIINNHKLFRNMLVVIKCILHNIKKNITRKHLVYMANFYKN